MSEPVQDFVDRATGEVVPALVLASTDQVRIVRPAPRRAMGPDEPFACTTLKFHRVVAAAGLGAVAHQVLAHILATMKPGNEVRLNQRLFAEKSGRSRGAVHKGVTALRKADILRALEGGDGQVLEFLVNPHLVWRGGRGHERRAVVGLWDLLGGSSQAG